MLNLASQIIQRQNEFSLQAEQTNLMDYYKRKFLQVKDSVGNCMKASAAVESYDLSYEFDTKSLALVARVYPVFRPEVVEAWKSMPLRQKIHRSRAMVLFSNYCQPAELDKRYAAATADPKFIAKHAIEPRLSNEVVSILRDGVHKYSRYDEAFVRHYLKNHSASSSGVGTWGSFLLDYPSRREMLDIFENTLRIMNEALANPELYNGMTFNSGGRARASPYDHDPFTDPRQSAVMDRSRTIFFHPALSMMSMFIPDHHGFYGYVLDRVVDAFGIAPTVHCPLRDGGFVYTQAHDAFSEGYDYRAFDGKNWESNVPRLLPNVMNSQSIGLGAPQLPSGIAFTSLLGTCATLAILRKCPGRIEEATVLGDDLNLWGSSLPQRLGENIVVEFQEEDTVTKQLLGMAYAYDVDRPRSQGIKIMGDGPDKALRLDAAYDVTAHKHVVSHFSHQEIQTVIGLYLGVFPDGDSFLDKLRARQNLDLIGAYSPSDLIDRIVQ